MPSSIKGTLETILVVDDDEVVLKAIVRLLEDANFRVFAADSGAKALKLAEAMPGPIHLLLSEVELLQMSGPDLGKTLKKKRTPGIVGRIEVKKERREGRRYRGEGGERIFN